MLGVGLITSQLIYLEGILSIADAAMLRGQRPAALKVGLLGAHLGRASMLFDPSSDPPAPGSDGGC